MRLTFFVLIFALLPLSVQSAIRVVTSIQPLYEITAEIMAGVAEPELLIKSQASAHHFAFKPSQFKLFDKADLVIWIDRYFESGFQRLPRILPEQTTQLELLRVNGLQSKDGHIWYSPQKLPLLVKTISRYLVELDPAHTRLYQANADKLIDDIRIWHNSITIELQSATPRYVLDHDFLGSFETDMGLQAVAILHDSHDRPSSISQIKKIEKDIVRAKARCLLIDESSVSKLGQNFARQYGLAIHDINAADFIESHRSAFIGRLYRLSAVFQLCK